MKGTMTRVLLLLAVFAFVACGGKKATTEDKKDDKTTTTEEKKTETVEAKFKAMILKGDKPITWVGANEKEPYIFFRADGTFADGDNTGEPSMEEGKWKFDGDKLMVEITGQEDKGWIDVNLKINSSTSMSMMGVEFSASAD